MRRRRVLVPPLKGDRMRAFFNAMQLETLEAVRAWPIGTPIPHASRDATGHVACHPTNWIGSGTGPTLDRFEQKMEKFLSNGRQRYALVLMTIVPIERLTGSRWVPLFRQLSDLDDDLFAFIVARRRGEHSVTGQNVLDDLLEAKRRTQVRLGIAKFEMHSSPSSSPDMTQQPLLCLGR